MKPILFPENEKVFDTNGIGILSDAISCLVTESRNGEYELEMEYPVDGIHFSEITDQAIILAKPNPTARPQPFRVYFQAAPMNGAVRFLARHVSYDLAGKPVDPFTAANAPDAMAALAEHAVLDSGFTFWTDVETTAQMALAQPMAIRSVLGGTKGSILDTYGGEYEFDRFDVKLHANRGRNRGVSIRYGKNLTDILQERNCAAVHTGVYPYWKGQDGLLVRLPEKIVSAPGEYSFEKIYMLDASSAFQEAPSEDQLRAYTENYISSNNIGVPDVSISLSFITLEQTEEYKDLALLERVDLCDTVNVEFVKLGVSTTAKVVKTVYDCLRERYERIEVGSVRANIANTIVKQQQALDKVQSPSFLQNAVDRATSWIVNGKGYMLAVRDAAGNWQEICSLDTPDIQSAVNVWRWNNGGLAHSANGYNGPFNIAITQDGHIVADFITAGTLDAALIKVINLVAESIVSGKLSSVDGSMTIDLDNSMMAINQEFAGFETRLCIHPGFFVWQVQDAGKWREFFSLRPIALTDSSTETTKLLASITDGDTDSLNPGLRLNGRGGLALNSSYGDIELCGKIISWKDNGNGTSTLIGTEVT